MASLATFIRASTGEIVELSGKFARTLEPFSSERIDIEILNDHLPLVLAAVANDLEHPQTGAEAIEKSEGKGPATLSQTAAQVHGRLRADSGLTVDQVVSEYRVLRATVTRLWIASKGAAETDAINDLVRFNEAIDQAIAESVAYHSAEVERWRAVLLAVVGHDLRDPLSTVAMTTEVLAASIGNGPLSAQIGLLRRGGDRLRVLLDSLLEYSNARLGAGMELHRGDVDLDLACRKEIELLRSAFPTAEIGLRTRGKVTGRFDENRVRQALTNLVANAVQYREPGTAINVILNGHQDRVVLTVENVGDPLDPNLVDTLFEPLRRREATRGGQRRNLGLGLFIVREIARAHGGEAFAESRDGKIAFCICLPFRAPPASNLPG
jgi:signal transduction histidine kinase